MTTKGIGQHERERVVMRSTEGLNAVQEGKERNEGEERVSVF